MAEFQTENMGWYEEYELLITVSEKCFHAAEKLDSQKESIRRIRVGAAVFGGVGIAASFFTMGVALAATAAAMLTVFYLATGITKWILGAVEMKHFAEEWEEMKIKARRKMMEQSPGDDDVEHRKKWAERHLERTSAEAVKAFLSASSPFDPEATDRLKRLDEHQLGVLIGSLINMVLADISAFEMITGSVASKRSDPVSVLHKTGLEIKQLAQEEYRRQKKILKQLRDIACEESSDDSTASSMDSDDPCPVEQRKGTPVVLRMRKQEHFCVDSEKGGTFQLKDSDIILDIPPGAIPVEEVHIQAAVCTDFEYIRRTFHLDDDEEIVSPLVEFKLLESLQFLKPVSIYLPHLLLEKSDPINVYHVSMNEDGTFIKQRITDYIMNSYQEDSTEGQQTPHIIIKTSTFSYFFACKLCGSDEKRFPELLAAVKGDFITKGRPREDQQFKVQLRIWDRRLVVKDFRKVFHMPHELTCKKCLKKGKCSSMGMDWLLYTRSEDCVALSVEVQHHGHKGMCAMTPMLCIIERGFIPPEVIKKLQRMGPQQHARVAQEMDISSLQFEHLFRHLTGGGPPTTEQGAQASRPQLSTSAHGQLSVARPSGRFGRRQPHSLPLGIPVAMEVAQTDDHDRQTPPAGDRSLHSAAETTGIQHQLHELKLP